MMLIWILTAVALLFGFVVAFGAPYVPSLKKEVRNAFTKLYPVSQKDVVADLGSGDGSVLREAARHGAKVYGIELNPLLVLISNLRLRGHGRVRLGNMWAAALPDDVTLVYVFSVTRDGPRLLRTLEREATRLKRPLNVMTFGEGLRGRKPVRTLNGHSLYEINPMQS